MRIAIVTQEDYFFVPKNIEKIAGRFGHQSIKMIVLIDSKGSINNKKRLFVQGFGILQSIKYGFKVLKKKLTSVLTFLRLSKSSTHSIAAIANHFEIPFVKVKNVNELSIVKKLEVLELDMIVSFSAPVVFKHRLLNAAKLGCINLHCSYLPFYAGLFPSFWVLHRNEKYTGCTVHKMDTKIDNGDILMQERVVINPGETIFSLLNKTKSLGGDIMVKVIEGVFQNNIEPLKNAAKKENYFSWPTLEELYIFRKNGGKLL